MLASIDCPQGDHAALTAPATASAQPATATTALYDAPLSP